MFAINTRRLALLSLCCLLPFTPAQAIDRHNSNLEGRLRALEERVGGDSSTQRRSVNAPTDSSMAGLQVELSRMQEELRQIRGGIEENRFAIEQLRRDMQLSSEENAYRFQILEQKAGISALGDDAGEAPMPDSPAVTQPAPQPAPVLTPPQASASPVILTPQSGVGVPVGQPAPDASYPHGVPPQDPAAQAVPESGLDFTDPAEHYNYAVSLIKEHNYDRARASLQRFLTLHKGHALEGNAYYWLGETYYVGSDFATAADTFRQGFEANPGGVKAADNLYKLAKSLLHMDKKNEACIVLAQIQKRYSERNPEVAGLAFETHKANSCQ